MKIITTKYFYFIIVFIIILVFTSCNKDESPISPPEPPVNPPDTISRYIWTVKRFPPLMFNVYAADTNLLYIEAYNDNLLIYDGSNISPFIFNDPNFRTLNVYGYDKNNIFVAGYTINVLSILPTVKKVTNGNIESFILDNEESKINDLLVTGPNQAWFSSYSKSKVYYFNSGIITEHRLSNNDSIADGIFYKNANNEIFVFAKHYTSSDTGYLYTYKLTGQNFQFLRKDCLQLHNINCLSEFIFRCGTDAIMLTGLPIIKYFNGTEWIVHSELLGSVIPFKIGGVSKDSLVVFCAPWREIYTYNGVKWRKENGSPFLDSSTDYYTNIETKFGNVYFTYFYELEIFGGHIIIGRPNRTDTTTPSSPSHKILHIKE